jgi:tetratricopeptide (TPR) repeat protein
LFHLAKPDAAIAQGEKALRLSPRDPGLSNIYALLGFSHLVANHLEEATDFLIKSRAANSRIWWVYYGLASALALRGDLDEAKTALAEGIKLKPEVDSLARWRDQFYWHSPQLVTLEDKTMYEGLRRIGFPEK